VQRPNPVALNSVIDEHPPQAVNALRTFGKCIAGNDFSAEQLFHAPLPPPSPRFQAWDKSSKGKLSMLVQFLQAYLIDDDDAPEKSM
jgi:hypothetical protein